MEEIREKFYAGNASATEAFEEMFARLAELEVSSRLGAMSKTHVCAPKSFNFVPNSTMDNKKLHLKVHNHPLIGFLVL